MAAMTLTGFLGAALGTLPALIIGIVFAVRVRRQARRHRDRMQQVECPMCHHTLGRHLQSCPKAPWR